MTEQSQSNFQPATTTFPEAAPASRVRVTVSGFPVMEYDREREVTEDILEYLKHMDEVMGQGLTIDKKQYVNPSLELRAQYVANNLAFSLMKKDNAQAVAMCTWLGHNLPELREVQAVEDIEHGMKVHLVYADDQDKKPN